MSLPHCDDCSGTGWVSSETGPGVVRCKCFLDGREGRRLNSANIPSRYQHCALSNFETEFPGADRTLAGVRMKCERYVEDFQRVRHGLLFSGPVGVGKTHLGVATLRALIQEHGIRGHFADYRDLLRSIQDSYNPVSETSELQVLRPLQQADVLLLDELGARRPTAWVQDTVTHLLNDRYNREKITLVTTNFEDDGGADVASLEERIGKRLRSRLYEMCDPVALRGDDFRKGLKSASFRVSRPATH